MAAPQIAERVVRLVNEARELGLAVTVRCQCCGAPLTEATSIGKQEGPVCRTRTKNDPSYSTKNPAEVVANNQTTIELEAKSL